VNREQPVNNPSPSISEGFPAEIFGHLA